MQSLQRHDRVLLETDVYLFSGLTKQSLQSVQDVHCAITLILCEIPEILWISTLKTNLEACVRKRGHRSRKLLVLIMTGASFSNDLFIWSVRIISGSNDSRQWNHLILFFSLKVSWILMTSSYIKLKQNLKIAGGPHFVRYIISCIWYARACDQVNSMAWHLRRNATLVEINKIQWSSV